MNSAENNTPITPVYLRERCGKTQMQMAVSLGKTVGTISNWERRTKTPALESLGEIERMMEAYNCSFVELVEAFKEAQIKLTLQDLKEFLDRSGLSFEDWKELISNTRR